MEQPATAGTNESQQTTEYVVTHMARLWRLLFGASAVKCVSDNGEYVDHCSHHKGTDYHALPGKCHAMKLCDVYECCRCGHRQIEKWDF